MDNIPPWFPGVTQLNPEPSPLRVEVTDRRALRDEVVRLREEMAIDNIQLSEGCLTSMHPDAVCARAYVRASQRRIRDLTQQLVGDLWGGGGEGLI